MLEKNKGLGVLQSYFPLFFLKTCFLLLILLNSLRNLFIFCVNVDIDEILLLQNNKGQRVNFFRVISLCIS